jgi:uncharacterized delta-60 repeat protein
VKQLRLAPARFGCLVAVVLSLAAVPTADAAPLRLDGRFGHGGIARMPFRVGSGYDYGGASRPVRQPDGKVLALGFFEGESPSLGVRVWLARFRRTGQRDKAFGRGGLVRFGPGFIPDSIQLQPDGRIILVGPVGQLPGFPYPFPNQIGLMRLLPDGSRDRSFGRHGLVAWNPPWRADTNYMQITPAVLVPQADGRLLAGGPVNEGRLGQDWLAFARFNQDGSVDQSFGHAGVVEDQVDGWQFAPPFFEAWAALPDGHIVAVDSRHEGPASSPESRSWWLDRFTADGTLDRGFGQDGSVRLGSDVGWTELVPARDGSLVMIGTAGSEGAVTIRRVLPGGQFDSAFGTACTAPSPRAYSTGAAASADGGLVATGTRFVRQDPGSLPRYDSLVIRFGADGCAAARPLRLKWTKAGPPLLRGPRRALVAATDRFEGLELIRIRR